MYREIVAVVKFSGNAIHCLYKACNFYIKPGGTHTNHKSVRG